jgi:cell division protein FtsW
LPATGQPLPLVSFGGSSLVMNLFAMGVLLNISNPDSGRDIKESTGGLV